MSRTEDWQVNVAVYEQGEIQCGFRRLGFLPSGIPARRTITSPDLSGKRRIDRSKVRESVT